MTDKEKGDHIFLIMLCFILLIPSTVWAKKAKLKIKGKLQLDVAFFHGDITPMGNGTHIRKASLGSSGKLKELLSKQIPSQWVYSSSYDFSDNETAIKDLWVAYSSSKYPRLKVGNFQIPTTVESSMGSSGSFFMESSLVDEIIPERLIGFSMYQSYEKFSWEVGYFGEDVETKRDEEDEGQTAIIHTTILPFTDDFVNFYLHIGASFSHFKAAKGDNELRFRSRPEIAVNDIRLISTDKMSNVEKGETKSIEFALSYQHWLLLGDIVNIDLTRRNDSSLSFKGGHLTTAFLLWGPPRYYDKEQRTIGRVRLQRSTSAAEVAFRTSWLDLTEKDIEGGVQRNNALSFNWYPNSLLKMSINYLWMDIERYNVNNNPQSVALRCQVSF